MPFLKDCFLTIIAQSSYPAITTNDFFNFFQKCKVTDPVTLPLATIDRIHIAACVKSKDNINFSTQGNALVRFEFFESLVRVALARYKESGEVDTFTEALKLLIEDKMLKLANPEPWQIFRDEELWTLDVNDVMETNLQSLRTVYTSFMTPIKKWMNVDDCIRLCMHDVPQLSIPEQTVVFCFAMSKMTIPKEAEAYKRY